EGRRHARARTGGGELSRVRRRGARLPLRRHGRAVLPDLSDRGGGAPLARKDVAWWAWRPRTSPAPPCSPSRTRPSSPPSWTRVPPAAAAGAAPPSRQRHPGRVRPPGLDRLGLTAWALTA